MAIVMMSLLSVLVGCLNGCVNQQNIRTSPDPGKNTNKEEIQSMDKASMSEDLLSRGEELMNLGRYAEGEDYLQRAVSMGNQDADILLSVFSILGKISHYSYRDSIYRLEQYRKNNLMASRAYALIWFAESQNPEHRNSKVNAYFAIRDHLRLEEDSDFAAAIPEANEFVRQLDDVNGVLWTFDFKKDPMTDEPICSLKSNEERGVYLGLNNQGIYIWTNKPLSDDFGYMGVRINGGEFYKSLETDEYKKREDAKNAVISLAGLRNDLSTSQTMAYLEEIRNTYRPSNYVYVAKIMDSNYERLLKELALGSQLNVRVKYASGAEEVIMFNLSESFEEMDQEISIFDIFGYAYVGCINGELH